MIKDITINNSEQYGVVVTIDNEDIADQLDDYLSEGFYIHYDIRESEDKVEFFFGQASSIDIVNKILTNFVP